MVKRVIAAAFSFLIIFSATILVFAKGTTTRVIITSAEPATGQGYVYLPGKADEPYRLNTKAIYRGREGNWFRATAAWQRAFRNVVHG
jgi:hypothetical protein